MKFKFLLLAAGYTAAACGSLNAQTRKYQVANGIPAIINHATGSAVVTVALQGVELINLDLTQPPSTTFTIKTTDYNFDGFRDFAFVGVNQASGTQVYDIFLYHPADKSFEILEVPGGICEAFGNVRLSAGDKTLRSSCRSGAKASQDIFRWASPFSLELVKSLDNTKETLTEQAEEKADRKTEKADDRHEKKQELKDRREDSEDE